MPYYGDYGAQPTKILNCLTVDLMTLSVDDCVSCGEARWGTGSTAKTLIDKICHRNAGYYKPIAPGNIGTTDEASTADYTYYVIGAIGLIAIIMMMRSK